MKLHIGEFSDERMLLELEKLMFYMHDGHSYVLPVLTKGTPAFMLPLQFYVFKDGVFIINADSGYKKLILNY